MFSIHQDHRRCILIFTEIVDFVLNFVACGPSMGWWFLLFGPYLASIKHHLLSVVSIRETDILNSFTSLPVSPDGLLLQSSTVADSSTFQFSDGVTESVPCSYIEFAERLVLPQYKNLPEEEVTNPLIVKIYQKRDRCCWSFASIMFNNLIMNLSRFGNSIGEMGLRLEMLIRYLRAHPKSNWLGGLHKMHIWGSIGRDLQSQENNKDIL